MHRHFPQDGPSGRRANRTPAGHDSASLLRYSGDHAINRGRSRAPARRGPTDGMSVGIARGRGRGRAGQGRSQVPERAVGPMVVVVGRLRSSAARRRARRIDARSGGLADPQLPTHIRDRRACLRLAERVGDLLLRELRLLHPVPPGGRGTAEAGALLYLWRAVDFGGDVILTVGPVD